MVGSPVGSIASSPGMLGAETKRHLPFHAQESIVDPEEKYRAALSIDAQEAHLKYKSCSLQTRSQQALGLSFKLAQAPQRHFQML